MQMKYGYTEGDFREPPVLLESEIVSGTVFWMDKEGGLMIGRSAFGVHESEEEAWIEAMKGLAFQCDHSNEIAKRHSWYCAAVAKQRPTCKS